MAVQQAEFYLIERKPGKAVEVLEAPLKRVNVNRKYLNVLREAYRAYILELRATNQKPLAETYENRLRILENPGLAAPQPQPVAPITAAIPANVPPATAALASNLYNPVMPGSGTSQPATPAPETTTARGKIGEDPFDPSNRLAGPAERTRLAQNLLNQAETEFERKRWIEARLLYEQANRTDAQVNKDCRERWAYCKLQYVVNQVNQAGQAGCAWPELEREVHDAVAMAPGLSKTGKWLLGEIDSRRPAAAKVPTAAALAVAVEHREGNAQGWQVAETRYFRILHKQPRDLVEKVARVAEQTRLEMYRKWFGSEGEAWQSKCDVFLHATTQDYHQATGAALNSPGHSRIETDPSAKRVVSRRIHLHCDNTQALLVAVLPHETTHVVLAGEFGGHAVPRWADEGMAVLAEPAEKRAMHQRNLGRASQEKELFTVRQLMELQDYPHARKISAFYAQSVSLVEFLTKQKGPVTFARFLRDGLREGYEPALRRHYSYRDYGELQTSWNQQLVAELDGVAGTYAGR